MDGQVVDRPRTLTAKQTAALIGVTTGKLYEMLRGKRFKRSASKRGIEPPPLPPPPPHFRVGHEYRFPRDGVEQWIREQTNSNADAKTER